MNKRFVAALVLTGATLAVAAPAQAHVTVSAHDPQPNEPAQITVRVPTESDTASTTRVEVKLPEELVDSAEAPDIAGWRPTKNGAVITWSATDGGTAPHQIAHLTISVRSLPAGVLYFPAVQSYSDGTVVSWSERGEPGVSLARPAPTLAVGVAEQAHSSSSGHGAQVSDTAAAPATSQQPVAAATGSADTRSPGWTVAIVIAVVVVLAGSGFALVRRRRS